jgi:hypothetical protein
VDNNGKLNAIGAMSSTSEKEYSRLGMSRQASKLIIDFQCLKISNRRYQPSWQKKS